MSGVKGKSGVYARPFKLCSIEGCDKKHYSKSLCHKHYSEICCGEYNKQWRQDNSEYIAEYRKQWHKNNPEYRHEYDKQWYQTPTGKASVKAHNHNHRVLTKDLTKETVQRVYEDNIKKYGVLTCVLCNKPIAFGEDSLEHLTPLSRGGSNFYNNLGISHLKCNKQKYTMTLEEWENVSISIMRLANINKKVDEGQEE